MKKAKLALALLVAAAITTTAATTIVFSLASQDLSYAELLKYGKSYHAYLYNGPIPGKVYSPDELNIVRVYYLGDTTECIEIIVWDDLPYYVDSEPVFLFNGKYYKILNGLVDYPPGYDPQRVEATTNDLELWKTPLFAISSTLWIATGAVVLYKKSN